MKKRTFILLIGAYCSISAIRAQPDCSGVYLTANDFVDGKLCQACAGRSTTKQSYYNLLAKSQFFILRADYAWRRIDKKDVFAIKGCEGEIVRIYEGNNYYLQNPGDAIPIYKSVMYPASKGNIIRVKYCFSINPVSEIQELTIDNLKAAFRDNRQFGDAVDVHFRDDSDLYAYNKTSKYFELTRVFESCK